MTFNYTHLALGLLGVAAAVTCGTMLTRRNRLARIEARAAAPRRLSYRGSLRQFRR